MHATSEVSGPVRRFEKVISILTENGNDPARLIPILQAIQAEYRYLPEEVLTYVATTLGTSPARVFGVATFYAHFALTPKGRFVVRVCDGTACHVKGSPALREALEKRLGVTVAKPTTDDMLFTLETVSCIGACGLAPAVTVDEQVHGMQDAHTVVALVDELLKSEANR